MPERRGFVVGHAVGARFGLKVALLQCLLGTVFVVLMMDTAATHADCQQWNTESIVNQSMVTGFSAGKNNPMA